MRTLNVFKKLPVWLLGACLSMGSVSVYAIHLNDYEMDGDTDDSTTITDKDADASSPDDADTIFHEECNAGTIVLPANNPGSVYGDGSLASHECGSNAGAAGFRGFDIGKNAMSLAFEQKFIDDEFEPDITHHQPSNKDEAPIGGAAGSQLSAVSQDPWGCVSKPNVNNKNDLLQGFVAFYDDGAGGVRVYAGGARDKNEGNENLGVWLLKDRSVGCMPGANNSLFTGVHLDGDRLIVGEFTNGGTAAAVKVFRWNDFNGIPEDGDETLTQVGVTRDFCSSHAVDAGGVPRHCGEVNTDDIFPAWEPEIFGCSATGAGNKPLCGVLQQNQWGEIAAQLLNPGDNECFAKVMIETRTSQSVSANLFDYMLADVNICGTVTIVKETIGDAAETFQYTNPTSLTLGDLGDPTGDTGTTTGVNDFSILTAAAGTNSPSVLDNATINGWGSVVFSDVSPGAYRVIETDPTSDPGTFAFNLLECTETGGTANSAPDGTNVRQANINVEIRETVTCTYRNVQPELKITKDVLSCNDTAEITDLGRFDLTYIRDPDGNNTGPETLSPLFLDDAHDTDDTTGTATPTMSVAQFVLPDVYEVTETIGSGGSLANYTKVVLTSGESDCGTDGRVTVSPSDTGSNAKNCTVVNVRKPTLVIKKNASPTSVVRGFNLVVGAGADAATLVAIDSGASLPDQVELTDLNDDGTDIGHGAEVALRLTDDAHDPGGNDISNYGTLTVGETFVTEADKDLYSTTISCDDGSTPTLFAPGTSATRTVNVPFGAGDTVECEVTNVRILQQNQCVDTAR